MDFSIGFAALVFSIQCTTFVDLRLQKMGDFHENHILQWEILNFEGLGMENFRSKYESHTLMPKTCGINHLAYVRNVSMSCKAEKKVRSNPNRKLELSMINNLSRQSQLYSLGQQ